MWRGQQATSRGAMWEGRGSLVYPHIVHRVAPKMLPELCVGRTTRHEHVCPRSEGVQRTTRRTDRSAFRLEELSVPRSWHGRYHVCGVGWHCWGRLTHCSLARRGDAVGRWAFVAARTRWWHGLSVLWGTVGCHCRSSTDSFESTAAAGDADASSCGISAERPRGAPHARRCIRCCRGWRQSCCSEQRW